MKKFVSDKELYNAFRRANLGDDEHYNCWTALWGVRSKIWNNSPLKKEARKSLGQLVLTAIEEGDSSVFRKLADGLDVMKIFERLPENALRADIFFAVEELNNTRASFTRAHVLSWLNEEMDAVVSAEELDRELVFMELADAIPEEQPCGESAD